MGQYHLKKIEKYLILKFFGKEEVVSVMIRVLKIIVLIRSVGRYGFERPQGP